MKERLLGTLFHSSVFVVQQGTRQATMRKKCEADEIIATMADAFPEIFLTRRGIVRKRAEASQDESTKSARFAAQPTSGSI